MSDSEGGSGELRLHSPPVVGMSPVRHMPGIMESPADTLDDDAYNAWNEMMETEGAGIAQRVHELERKVLEQGDELVCLRATLADSLRRLSLLEGMRPSTLTGSPNNITPLHQRNGTASSGVSSGTSAGYRDSGRIRQTIYRNNSSSAETRDPVRRASSYVQNASSLPQQRRGVHYQSTGSLHSDSPSSSSVSPVPSPSPRATPLPHHAAMTPKTPSHTPRPSPSASAVNSTNFHLAKRWSSIGDFNNVQGSVGSMPSGGMSPGVQSRFSTKSLLNLYSKPSQYQPAQKHGTRDATYNEEEGTLRMYLRGRPVVLHAPTDQIDSYDISKVATAPSARLKLDWVYGYRGRDCRSNLYLLPTGEMVYFVAATVVLFNVEEQCQRHYIGHTDDVKSLAIHPNKLLVATGQCAGHDKRDARPHIRIWNSVSLATMSIISGEFEKSICCLSFSKADSGVLLVAIDESPDHNISVWDWQKGEHGAKITETKCSVDTVVAAEFHPLDRNVIITCGKSNISFWSLDNGGTLYKRMGIFENRDKPKYVTCVAFTQTGDVVSGDSNGNLIVWGRGTNTISKMVKGVHDGSVFSICVMKEGSIVSGGGKDGRLIQFDSQLNRTGEEAQVELHFGGIRVVSEGRGTQLLIGTTRNCILTGAMNLGFQPAILGHADELWGLAAHPSLPQFATAGIDRLLQMWDSMSHSVIWSKDIGEQAQSVAFSADGSVVIVGCLNGRWIVFDSETREMLGHHTDGAEPLQVLRFSPDGQLLAIGSRDNYIYVYQVNEDSRKYSRVGRCMGHSSFITHLDWSTDSQIIRSNSGDYELLYWNASTCRQVPQSSSMRDVEWASNTCTLTFQTVGIWPEGADGTDVNNCDRSHDSKLLATADDFGKVKLYAYPVSQPRSLCHTYGGHSSHVTSVTFLHDDTRVVSTGGNDTSVMQWMIT